MLDHYKSLSSNIFLIFTLLSAQLETTTQRHASETIRKFLRIGSEKLESYNFTLDNDLTNQNDGRWIFMSRLKSSEWIQMKHVKVISFSKYLPVEGKHNRMQLNCLSGNLCDVGPDHVTCENLGFHTNDFKYQCTAILRSDIEFGKLNITCQRKADDDAQNLKDALVLKGSCSLNFSIKHVDLAIRYLKFFIFILCLIIFMALFVYAINSCFKQVRKEKRTFLTSFYFTPVATVYH